MTDPLITRLDRVTVAIHSADDCAPYPGGKPWLSDDWERYERMAKAAISEAEGAPRDAHCCCGLVGTNYYTTHHCGVCGQELPEDR